MIKEFNMANLEKAVEQMKAETSGVAVIEKKIMLSDFAISLGFSVETAQEYIRQELL